MNDNILILKDVHLIDPAKNIDATCDITLQNDILTSLEKVAIFPDVCQVVNGQGMYASPGWIDFHTHVYQYSTALGVNVDETCLHHGVTTVVDAGSSGSATFLGLKKYIIEKSLTRVKALLHVANHGLASATCTSEQTGGESDSVNQLDENDCIKCIRTYPEDIVGIKIRLSASACNEGRNEQTLLSKSLKVRDHFKDKPLMTHHADSTISTSGALEELGCPSSLRKGDIYTHMFHSYVIKNGRVNDDFKEARQRGVLFDVGHGMGSFSWKNAEICSEERFWPDIISTDLHTFSLEGPAYSLPIVMSKLHHLGMKLNDVIKAVTLTPAKAMHLSHQIGKLEIGLKPDITIFRMNDVTVTMEDCFGEIRVLKKTFQPVGVIRDGRLLFFKK